MLYEVITHLSISGRWLAMQSKDLILAIDNGTQSLKALIFDPQGQLQAKEAVTFDPYFSEQPAWAEQHPTRITSYNVCYTKLLR